MLFFSVLFVYILFKYLFIHISLFFICQPSSAYVCICWSIYLLDNLLIIYLFVPSSICLFSSLSIYSFIYLFVNLYIPIVIYPSIQLFVYQSFYLFDNLFISYLFVDVFIYIFTPLSISLFIYLSFFCLFINLYIPMFIH